MIAPCDAERCAAAGCEPAVCRGAGLASNDEVYARSTAVIPGGVNSSIRGFRSVGGRPYAVARAQGAHIWDVEGTRYIDLVQSYGAVILGHAHPAITAAVREAAGDGTSYGAPTPREMQLAAGGSGVATLGLPGTAGVPKGAVAETLVVPYNRVPQLDESVACVILEPIAANMGVVAPASGFLEGLRAECDRVGAVLVFDEVITGFRIGEGGAQAMYGVTPDLTTFGKVIGGGLPIGAVGGPRRIMETLSPLGPVF